MSSNTTAILCGAAGVPVEVGYGLVAPLASVDMTLTVVVGKRDDTTDDRTLSANLSQITWKRGHTHKIQIPYPTERLRWTPISSLGWRAVQQERETLSPAAINYGIKRKI